MFKTLAITAIVAVVHAADLECGTGSNINLNLRHSDDDIY